MITVSPMRMSLRDFVLVVQGGAADGAAGQEHRLQFGHRRQHARAAHLHGDAVESGLGLFRRVFVGDGPARRFGGVAGPLAQASSFSLMTAPSVS